MGDGPALAQISSDQRLSDRLILPYLRESTGLGLSSSYVVNILPTKPISTLDTLYQFEFPKFENSVLDLKNTLLSVRGRLVKVLEDRTAEILVAGTRVLLVNNSLYSLFDSVTVHLGVNQAEYYSNLYSLKCYMRQLFTQKEKHAGSASLMGFNYEVGTATNDVNNAVARLKLFAKSRTVEFLGPTLIDPFQTLGYLQSNIGITVTYNRSDPRFYLLTDDTTGTDEFRFEITDIAMKVRVLRVQTDIQPYLKTLCADMPARYHYTSMICRVYQIAADSLVFNMPRLFTETVPQRLMCGLYQTQTLLGSKLKTPYFTSSSVKVRSIKLHHNGLVVRELRPDFSVAKRQYGEAYRAYLEYAAALDRGYMIGKLCFNIVYYIVLYCIVCVSPRCVYTVCLSSLLFIYLQV